MSADRGTAPSPGLRSAVIPPEREIRLLQDIAKRSLVLVILIATILAWEGWVRFRDIPNYLFPKPSTVVDRLVAKPAVMAEAFFFTFFESIIGFALASVVGIALAILIARSALLERLLYPYLNIIRVTPVIAIAPLLTIWFGHGILPQALIAALIAFFPIVVTTVLGLKSVDPELVSLMRLLNATEAKELWKIRLPNALPYIFSAFRISAPLAVVGALVGEFVGGAQGLGWILITARGRLDTSTVFLMVVLAVLLGIASFTLVVAFEKRFVKWHPAVVLE
ncbi:MAG: ABC transporter permease [bacterium]|nr:ABC transporter permease [bacterium]MDE0288535.1 ABC transporter permease [bacterium]MDE0438796.1 ABC transporter permease [bacterium]